MKSYNRRNFTLLELMFVIAILVILIGISWAAGATVLRNQAKNKTKTEIAILMSAVRQYNERFPGTFPWGADNVNVLAGLANSNKTTTVTTAYASLPKITWGQYLSPVLPNSGWTNPDGTTANARRPMFVDFSKNNIYVSNASYDIPDAIETRVRDPYERDYCFFYDAANKSYAIWSAGLDGTSAFPFQEHGPVTTVGRALYNRKDDVSSTDFSK